MLSIWKFELIGALGVQDIMAPLDMKPLSVAYQHTRLTLWGEVVTDKPMVSHHMYVAGTGQRLPDTVSQDYTYIGTASAREMPFVWHVYIKER